jgi:hypothetical protein
MEMNPIAEAMAEAVDPAHLDRYTELAGGGL